MRGHKFAQIRIRTFRRRQTLASDLSAPLGKDGSICCIARAQKGNTAIGGKKHIRAQKILGTYQENFSSTLRQVEFKWLRRLLSSRKGEEEDYYGKVSTKYTYSIVLFTCWDCRGCQRLRVVFVVRCVGFDALWRTCALRCEKRSTEKARSKHVDRQVKAAPEFVSSMISGSLPAREAYKCLTLHCLI